MNLYYETERKLKLHDKTWDDVKWIGYGSELNHKGDLVRKGGCIPKVFWKKALDVEYDNSYGSAEINPDLYVVGDNWWMQRGEYDGSEWWDFLTMPIEQTTQLNFGEWEINNERHY